MIHLIAGRLGSWFITKTLLKSHGRNEWKKILPEQALLKKWADTVALKPICSNNVEIGC